MVAPVTGPFFSYPTESYADHYRQKWRQKMPLDRPLPYIAYRYYGRVSFVTYSGGIGGTLTSNTVKQADFGSGSFANYSNMRAAAYNAAYERLKSRVGDRAGWAENIAQINKTRRTIVDRSVQLARFVTNVRRGRFSEAARVLRTPIPSGVSNRKALAQNFLEWEYGVKPVISDLQASTRILLSDPGVVWAKGRASEKLQSSTFTTSSTSGAFNQARTTRSGYVDVTCRTGVRVTNPNVSLANQLGLIDLALPWKLVPFSFVVDWFINVEQVISSVTDWYGMSLQHPHYTVFSRGTSVEKSSTNNWSTGSWSTTDGHKEYFEMNRYMGLPSPTLIVKPFKGFSLQRGLQAISLVIATLGK